MGLALLLALAVDASVEAAVDGQDDEGTCVTCHEVEIDEALAVPVPEWRDSVHFVSWVSCDACHGGDPRIEDADESMSEAAGFMRLPSWTEMSEHCGACHEEVAAGFRGGRYGRAIEAGQRAATCATCHMQDGHRTLASRPEEIATTCAGCPSLADPDAAVALLVSVRAAERALGERIDDVESKGIELSDYRADLLQVRQAFARALHEFDDDGLDAARALAVTQYDGIGEQLGELDREADGRLRLGTLLLSALALLFAALWVTLRNLD